MESVLLVSQLTWARSRQTVEVVREAPEKPASRTCAAVGFRLKRNVPQPDFGTTAGSHIYG